MGKRIIIFLLLLKVGILMTAEAWRRPTTRVIKGQKSVPHRHPYMISLHYRILFWRRHFCGGTLLSAQWILTASRCLEHFLIRWLPIEAVAGIHKLSGDEDSKKEVISIDRQIMHPSYSTFTQLHDIAMVHTSKPFTLNKFIKPVILPTSPKISTNLTFIGWGAVDFVEHDIFVIPILPNELQEVKVEYLPFDLCIDAFENTTGIILYEEIHICTVAKDNGSCYGDVGGPLLDYPSPKDYYFKYFYWKGKDGDGDEGNDGGNDGRNDELNYRENIEGNDELIGDLNDGGNNGENDEGNYELNYGGNDNGNDKLNYGEIYEGSDGGNDAGKDGAHNGGNIGVYDGRNYELNFGGNDELNYELNYGRNYEINFGGNDELNYELNYGRNDEGNDGGNDGGYDQERTAKEEFPVVVGVASWILGNCIGPRVYTRVDTHLKFINTYLKQ